MKENLREVPSPYLLTGEGTERDSLGWPQQQVVLIVVHAARQVFVQAGTVTPPTTSSASVDSSWRRVSRLRVSFLIATSFFMTLGLRVQSSDIAGILVAILSGLLSSG